MIPRTAIKPGTRVRFTQDLHLHGITTVLAGTTGTITSDDYTDEAPCFLVDPDDRVVRNDLADCGGYVHMMPGWEVYLELDEPFPMPPALSEETPDFPVANEV
jgi:hypothetical protein